VKKCEKRPRKQSPLEEAAEDKAALEEIAKIRRNGFNPGEEQMKLVLLNRRPIRALAIMRVAAAVDRKIVPYH
jgi:hypothetical protein